MEKQVALGSFVPDFRKLCLFVQFLRWFSCFCGKRTLLMLYLFYKKYFFRPLRRLYI